MTNEPTAHTDGAGEGENLAAKRYAVAAFELAQENNDSDAWLNAVRQIAEFMGDPEVKRVLENARVSQEPKQRLIDAALGDLPALPLNLARLLVRKNRTALAVDIATQLGQLLEQQRGVSRARATTAVPLGDAEREALSQRLAQHTGGEVVLETAVDPALLGGVVVQIGDRLIDASTRSKLRALRDNLTRAF
ncbi:MAG TPA: ATP synthase F1 subunit delta [Dehalococcoidia bacterium]|nr:ATP synthase F1 subunit delta [Dehalococcoidia bacterium]